MRQTKRHINPFFPSSSFFTFASIFPASSNAYLIALWIELLISQIVSYIPNRVLYPLIVSPPLFKFLSYLSPCQLFFCCFFLLLLSLINWIISIQVIPTRKLKILSFAWTDIQTPNIIIARIPQTSIVRYCISIDIGTAGGCIRRIIRNKNNSSIIIITDRQPEQNIKTGIGRNRQPNHRPTQMTGPQCWLELCVYTSVLLIPLISLVAFNESSWFFIQLLLHICPEIWLHTEGKGIPMFSFIYLNAKENTGFLFIKRLPVLPPPSYY